MPQIVVEVPESLMEELHKKAEEQKKSIKEVVVESIEAMLEDGKEENRMNWMKRNEWRSSSMKAGFLHPRRINWGLVLRSSSNPF